MDVMSFLEQVYDAGTPRETKADVVEYYQEKYTGSGQKGWKQNLIHDLLGARDITRGSVGDVEYKRLAKNTARRFDPSRIENPEPRNAAEYESLGETLPPRAPYGLHIDGSIYVTYSKDACVERIIEEDIVGDAAKALFLMAEEDMKQAIFNAYQSDGAGDIEFKGPSQGDCANPVLTVTAIEEE
jgi:hypothetical protein